MDPLGVNIYKAANRYLDDDETAEYLTNDVRNLIAQRLMQVYRGHAALSLDEVAKGLGLRGEINRNGKVRE